MKYSYNWLKKLIDGDIPEVEELAGLLTRHSFEVEEIAEQEDDYVLDIDVLPNRASDCLSHYGIAREIVAILQAQNKGAELKELSADYKKNEELTTQDLISLEVKAEDQCSRYTGKVVEVEVGESPAWLKQRLKACGLQSINNVVDVANYVMLETGQPLHAFDLEKIKGDKIIVREADSEKLATLDNETYELENNLIIADQEKPLAIAGIKGGLDAGVDKDTQRIILEAANFDSVSIRKTSRELKLRTDASWRFENGLDENLAERGLERAASLLQKVAEGRASSDVVDYYPEPRASHSLSLDTDYVKDLLGVDISEEDIVEILESLSFEVSVNKELEVEVPTFRLDINRQEDLIEEIGRIYGYQNIEPETRPVALTAEENMEVFWKSTIKDIFKESGLLESYNYSFASEEQINKFDLTPQRLLEVENPVSSKFKYLRPTLIPNLIENANENARLSDFETPQGGIRLFEIGQVFTQENENSERTMLGGVVAHTKGTSDNCFYEGKGIIDNLLEKLGISNVLYDDYQPTPDESEFRIWDKAKSAEIQVGEKEIGFLGLVSNEVLEKGIEELAAFELNFDVLQKFATEEQEYQPISHYPSAVRDLAVLVPQDVKVAEVLNKINSVGGSLIRDIDLFDMYQGPELPGNKKNLAFHIIYQSEEKTLEAEEIDNLQQEIIEALEEDPDWQVRK